MVFALISSEILTVWKAKRRKVQSRKRNISTSFSTVFLVMICFLWSLSTMTMNAKILVYIGVCPFYFFLRILIDNFKNIILFF